MDSQSESEAEFIVVSTSDYAEGLPSSAVVSPQVSGLTRNAKLFAKSFGFLPSFLGGARVTESQTSETSRTQTTKYSETIGMQAVDRVITNYNYYISGGVGGPGGSARDQGTGGGGGVGHGPTVYLGQSPQKTTSRDLDLVKEIRLGGQSSVVDRPNRGAGVRRMYSANLVVRESERKVTVAIYQGDGAEEEWRQDLTKYESIRHPNILQLYGSVNTKKLCAMVFHDELIPQAQFLRRFEHSSILTTYILGYSLTEWEDARDYYNSMLPSADLNELYTQLTLWIRPATGQLCVDLSLDQGDDNILSDTAPQDSLLRLEKISLDDPNAEALVISSLDKTKYHKLCSKYPIAQWRSFSISPQLLVSHWPTLFQLDSKQSTSLMLTDPLDFVPKMELAWVIYRGLKGEVLPGSWTRYDAWQAYNLDVKLWVRSGDSLNYWLSQANYILAQLQVTSDFEDYVFMHKIAFNLRSLPNPSNTQPPDGYLFVCPAEDFRIGENSFKWPDCPAYWSLDPSGATHLSSEEAQSLGFPVINIETRLYGTSWDESVYQGLRRFHAGKGFNPESQDMARDLGYPLFELLSEEVPPLEYVEEE
ncbi:hypothetical protein MSAN_02272600 [Mycena sanguinolenta]|uniref:Protein kinase domain-containing protein n=1 Tax=Mycena sanguinolenta TaxID=230812 RepID=A0A8H6X9N0_9AGAR|nr:hypothetical protein MSAN_02272600 [Mycena sanguinolenta]